MQVQNPKSKAQNPARWLGLAAAEVAGAGTLVFLLYYVQASGVGTAGDPWASDKVTAYVLMFAAALFLFAPASAALRLGPLWVIGTVSWALLGYVLLFVAAPTDRTSADFVTYSAFLTLAFLALGSVFAVLFGALGRQLFAQGRRDWVRALRQGALLSLFVVSVLAMSPLGVLNWLNVFLVFTIVALTEFFFLARA